MKRTACRLLAISSAALWLVPAAPARTRPRYGDTVRADTQIVVMSGDTTPDALVGTVFETLVTVDDSGNLQPSLATTWISSNNATRWEFTLRSGVTFHDSTPFNPAAVVRCLSKPSNSGWRVRAGNDSVIFEFDNPQPNLSTLLSLPQYAITSLTADGNRVGTGPFELDHRNGPQFVLKAFDNYWAGRPFLDSVELLTSRSAHDQTSDFSLDRADAVEVAPDQLRRSQQDHLRLAISRPSETLFLIADPAKAGLQDPKLRQAIALAIDRAALHNVIFQHQGDIAAGVLPNWLDGYEFLFNSAPDLARARQLRMEVGQVTTLTIGYDPHDPAGRLIAERIALNARDIGLTLQAVPASGDLRLRYLDLPSLDPTAALYKLLDQVDIASPMNAASTYPVERDALATYLAIPLVHLPRAVALKDRVRNWTSSPGGDWHFDNLWLAPRPHPEVRP